MGRALRNLVTSAIRHTPGGMVDVLAEVQIGTAFAARELGRSSPAIEHQDSG
jgi:signal transduction histidine kinase